MIKQYLSIKERYADTILFYRMGDFYEMFFEDAEVASRILEITLTSRNKKDEFPIPMCGVPYRAVQGYIARLINQGYKVAICDQVEDPKKAKGLVRREVTRVVTPGTVTDDALLDPRVSNYLASITPGDPVLHPPDPLYCIARAGRLEACAPIVARYIQRVANMLLAVSPNVDVERFGADHR